MIIGNKNEFAIQYEILNPNTKTGKFCIWLNNYLVGFYEEEVYLFYLINGFNSILNKDIKLDFFEISDNNNFDSSNLISELPMLALGESFDEFNIYVYLNSENYLVFIWNIIDEPWNSYPNDYITLRKVQVKLDVVKQILNQYCIDLKFTQLW